MKLILMSGGLVIALASLCACGRKTEPPATSSVAPAAGSTPAPTQSLTSPTAGIVPHDDEKEATSGGTGPAQASTAIGGLVGNQERGGAAPSSAPEPSGGDGSASKPAATPK